MDRSGQRRTSDQKPATSDQRTNFAPVSTRPGFVEMENGERLRVGLMPLAPAGYEAQAFVVFIPAGDTPDHLAAEDGDGVQLGTFEISNLGP